MTTLYPTSVVGFPRVSVGGAPQRKRSSMKTGGRASKNPRRSSLCSASASNGMEMELPFEEKAVRRHSSVSFNPDVVVVSIVSAGELADHGPQDLWLQGDEYKQIRSGVCTLVKAVLQGNPVGRYCCLRGLERLVQRNKFLARKNNAWQAVLEEQLAQYENNDFDIEYMAEIYEYQSIDAKEEAYGRAKRDEQVIATYLQWTRDECLNLSCD